MAGRRLESRRDDRCSFRVGRRRPLVGSNSGLSAHNHDVLAPSIRVEMPAHLRVRVDLTNLRLVGLAEDEEVLAVPHKPERPHRRRPIRRRSGERDRAKALLRTPPNSLLASITPPSAQRCSCRSRLPVPSLVARGGHHRVTSVMQQPVSEQAPFGSSTFNLAIGGRASA